MRVTHVVRGEEWLPSLPFHIQLFKALGFKLPKYLHCSQLMKMEGDSKKKLSKRDKAAALADYKKEGYDPVCITEYIMTLLNSNYEEWRTANPDKSFSDFPFAIKKLSASGSLFDYDKLDDIARTTVSRMSADEVYDALTAWAKEYDPEFYQLLTRDEAYTKAILAIGRGGKKPRKDITKWNGVRDYAGFFFDELFAPDYSTLTAEDTDAILTRYAELYDESADQTVWFDTIKAMATEFGYAAETKAYKADPDAYKGHVGDISNILRVAVTGRTASPDMYTVMQILGREKVLARLAAAKERN
jgi:glutamyl-tRNA synthetase